MKKVIGVAVAASLVAGMAFADVAVSLNARQKANLYTSTSYTKNGAVKAYTDTDTLKLNEAKDDLTFKANSDFAGVELVLTPKTDVESGGGSLAYSRYNGWLAFGALKFSFGTFDSRYVERYAVTATEGGLLDDDIVKFGTYLLKDVEKIAKDSNNISTLNGAKQDTVIADYTFKDLPGTLLVKAGLIQGATKYKAEASTTPAKGVDKDNQWAGYLFEADYAQDNLVKLQALLKMPTEDQMVVGIFVQPLMLPVNTSFGFTYASNKDIKFTSGLLSGITTDVTAMIFDARASYNVTDALKVTVAAKYENAKVDVSGADADTALSLGGEVSYIINDLVTVALDAKYENANLDDSDKAVVDSSSSKFVVRPAAVFTAGKNARVTAGLEYKSYLDAAAGKEETVINVPVIFRVKM